MKNEKLMYFKELLQTQFKDIDNTLEIMKKNGTAEQSDFEHTELSNYDNHPADMGTELFITEMNNALKVHEEHLQKEIHDALGRIENGIFGKCAFCGNEMSEERLEVIPYARLCIDCEKDKIITTAALEMIRPVEERVIDAPMGRKYLNQREDDEHEGMDQFYDLEKYGSSDSPQDLGGYHDYEEYYTNEIDRQGLVDTVDWISNEDYRKQLPDWCPFNFNSRELL